MFLVHVTVESSLLPGLLKVFSDGDLIGFTVSRASLEVEGSVGAGKTSTVPAWSPVVGISCPIILVFPGSFARVWRPHDLPQLNRSLQPPLPISKEQRC